MPAQYSDTHLLISALVKGEQKAFRHLYAEYYEMLAIYASRILGDFDEAKDVVQLVMTKLWENKEKLEGVMNIKAYLYRAVHNNCLNKLKKEKNASAYKDELWHQLKDIELDGHTSLLVEELNNKINASVEQFPPQCKRVFELSRFENKSYNEIAEQLSISVKAVEGNISRALKMLRKNLKEYLPLIIFILFNKG